MKRVVTAVVLVPLVLIALFRAPFWLFTLFTIALAVLSLREYFGLVRGQGREPFRILSYACCLGVFLAVFESLQTDNQVWAVIFGALLVGNPLMFLASGLLRPDPRDGSESAAASVIGFYYVVIPFLCLLHLRGLDGFDYLVFSTLVTVWVGDASAYYVGRTLGRHKLAPTISPNKTWEGSIASVLSSMVVGTLLLVYVDEISLFLNFIHLVPSRTPMLKLASFPLWYVIVFTIAINLAAQVGDLVESQMKRSAGLKDSGRLIPGHGGILDRIDAMLFALPVAWLFSNLSQFIIRNR